MRRAKDNPARQVSNTQPEPNQAPALVDPVSREAEGVHRITVRFTGYRVRPLDPDNFAGSVKDLLDGLRHAGIIPEDSWWHIKLETEQVKVSHFKEEETVIEILL